jgi:GT2 family glycosyltransferase
MRETLPRLSVVTPLFNCLALTQAMVESLRSTIPEGLSHEIILVDDGSTDGTRAWLATLGPPFRVVLNEKNLGYGAANNRGAAIAGGDILALLNNDLVLPPGWIEPLLEAHRSLGPRAGVAGNVQIAVRTGEVDHAGIVFNHKGKPEHDRSPPSALSRLLAPVRRVPAVTGACALVSRRLWTELGGFDEAYVNGCEDVDLCLRAAAAGKVNAVALRSVVRHHVSASPGRKERDERNTQRLVLRWRSTLVRLGARAWCREHLASHWAEPRDFPDERLARQAILHVLGLTKRPPAGAIAGVQSAIEQELWRWSAMFHD